MNPTREMTASNVPSATSSCSPSSTRVGDVAQPSLARLDLGELEKVRRDVGREDRAVRADAPSRRQRLATRAGRDIQHPIAWPDLCQVEHQFGRLTEPILDRGAPTMPRLRGLLPLRASGLFVTGRIERGCRRHVSPPTGACVLRSSGDVMSPSKPWTVIWITEGSTAGSANPSSSGARAARACPHRRTWHVALACGG